MTYDFSFLIPGIRTDAWVEMYKTLKKASKTLTTEIVFVGPFPLPDELVGLDDVLYIEDWGSPTRCQQIALLEARGKYCFPGSDDGFFNEGGLDHAFETIDTLGPRSVYHLGVNKYIEGSGEGMSEDWYYYLNNHGFTAPGIKNDWLLGCHILIEREHFIQEFGGYNMIFEGCAMACQELACRIQSTGRYKIALSKNPITKVSHMPGISGDHAPMHYAQIEHDQPLYQKIIPQIGSTSVKMDKNAWIKQDAIWNRRFGGTRIGHKYEYDPVKDHYKCIYQK